MVYVNHMHIYCLLAKMLFLRFSTFQFSIQHPQLRVIFIGFAFKLSLLVPGISNIPAKKKVQMTTNLT